MGDSKMVDTFIFKVTTPLKRFIVGLKTFVKARKASRLNYFIPFQDSGRIN